MSRNKLPESKKLKNKCKFVVQIGVAGLCVDHLFQHCAVCSGYDQSLSMLGRTAQQTQPSLTLMACCVCIEAKLELLFGSSSDLLNSHLALASEANPLVAPRGKREKMKCRVDVYGSGSER